MKKRYLFICLIMLLLLTGCNAKYSLEIKDNMIKETLTITGDSNDERIMEKDEFGYSFYDYSLMYGEEKDIETDVEGYYSEDECSYNCNFYEKKFINEDGKVGFELSNAFTFEEYSSSTIARDMIPAFSSTYDGRYLTISAGSNWNYYEEYDYLEKIEFLVETDYKVVSTNLNKVKDGSYEFSFKEDSSLYITIDTSIVNNIEKDSSNFTIYLIIILGVLILALIVVAINNRKNYR